MNDLKTFHGFREHVSEERFQVYEQPILHLATNDISHHEWLVRFEHDAGLVGVLRPAEINGAIKDLDLSMLARAVLTLNQKSDSPGIAINISGASIEDPDFERSIMACLSAYNGPKDKLILELTETWDLRDLSKAQKILSVLQSRGHPICLDDVGAGAASIRYLRAFPADWLKIDADFIRGAMTNDRELAILKAITSLKSSLGVKLIAEGIENNDIMQFAKSLQFDALQGYMIGKPQAIKGFQT